MQLNAQAERAIERLIERWDLHTDLEFSLPVPIRQVARYEGWSVYFTEGLFPLYGWAIVNGPHLIMRINADVSLPWQRHTMAHEMGHVLNGDQDSFHMCREFSWFNSKQERRASIAAAKILIPSQALSEIATLDEVASACEVPRELVELRVAAGDAAIPPLWTAVG